MRNVVIYNPGTGEVERWMRDHDDIVTADWFPGKAVLYVGHLVKPMGWLSYVVDGELVDRPEAAITVDRTSITADGVDAATITGIPAGTEATRVDSEAVTYHDIESGTFAVTSAWPGRIVVDLQPPFPYRKRRVIVEAA
jgi:hypothetical protein